MSVEEVPPPKQEENQPAENSRSEGCSERSNESISSNRSMTDSQEANSNLINVETFDDNLPSTVTLLRGNNGSKLYLIGTAHFSQESQDDVTKVIRAVKPHIVVVELCKSRASILRMDEETIRHEAKNLTYEKMWMTIKDNGVLQGLMYLLLLNLSAQLTRDLGMAPGGEFRRAFAEVKKMPGCILHFGDRPIQVTIKRALGVLSWWQCIRLAWSLIFQREKVSAEDVEKCKQTDLLESMLKEMRVDFPELGKVFVQERDVYLTHSLQLAANCLFANHFDEVVTPTIAVGVVGIGHTPGIKELWGKVQDEDIPPIMIVKEQSKIGTVVRRSLLAGVVVLAGWQIIKQGRKLSVLALKIPSYFT